MKKHLKKIMRASLVVGVCAVIIFLGVSFGGKNNSASAQSGNAMHGALWSDMPSSSDECLHGTGTESPNQCQINIDHANPYAGRGFGWISLNSTDPGASGNYAVTLFAEW